MYTFDDYQKFARSTAIYPPDASIVYPALGLASEAGEVAGKVKKYLRDGGEFPVTALKAELGDVLWYIAVLAAEFGISLSEVAQANADKLIDRASRGTLSGSGDNR
jgi:NTP pyrophosphatase (non-canonical NTP hydrolase)